MGGSTAWQAEARQIAQRRERIAELRAQGVPVRRIAVLLGCGRSTVARDIDAIGRHAPASRRLAPRARRPPRETPSPPPPASAPTPSGLASTAAAVLLAGRFGDLARIWADGVRADLERQLAEVRRQLSLERGRHAQELAAARARAERLRRDLTAQLVAERGRANELEERAAFAELRAEVVVEQLRGLEAQLPSAALVHAVPAV